MRQIEGAVSSILSSYQIGLGEKEELIEKSKRKKRFTVCVPKEIDDNEKRVSITPEGVEVLVADGFKVIIEENAGISAGFSDLEYSESGAIIVSSPEEAHKGDIIFKLTHPQIKEVEMIPEGKIVIANLHRRKPTIEVLRAFMRRKITGIAVECITDRLGGHPISNAMFPIEGKTIMLMAAELLSNDRGGQGILLGDVAGITPVEVVIIGAGLVSEHAAQVASVLGATVKIFSSSLDDLFLMKQNVGQALFTNVLRKPALKKALATADVVINTINFEGDSLSFSFTDDLMEVMKKRAVVLDMSAEGEAYFDNIHYQEHNVKLFDKHGILFHCMHNVSSRVAHTSSMVLNNIALDVVDVLTQSSNLTQVLRNNKGVRDGIYVFNGILTNKHLGQMYNIPHQSIDLLLAAF